jgi:hypothetical protein
MRILLCFVSLTLSWFSFGQNVNVSGVNVFDGEPYLTIDPSNPQHLVAAWMGAQFGQKVTIKSAYSNDGGLTWSTPIWQPHQVANNSSADVSLGYDLNGNLYMSYIDYDNENFTNGGIFVRRSTNGGQTWGAAVEAISSLDCPDKLCVDRPWMVIDRSGGPLDGKIYVTSMNADQPTLVIPPYNPYLAVSTDNGTSFNTPRYLDTLNYYAGSTITQPMPSPTVTANGTFMAIYPSYEPATQGPFAHLYIAKSTTAGVNIDHIDAYTGTGNTITNPYLKKGSLFKSDPSDANHLAYFFLRETSGDVDIYFMESFNGGTTWTAQQRINQDPVGTGKLQDLVWADFDQDGDLAVCWRDRRNATATGYNVETEIFCAVRYKDSTDFSPDFAITDTQVAHDIVLEGKGNDFMNVQFLNDTIYAVWGDVRTGNLSIYLNKIAVASGTSSISTITKEELTPTAVYPNPANEQIRLVHYFKSDRYVVFDGTGRPVLKGRKFPEEGIDILKLLPGSYTLILEDEEWQFTTSFIKE